MLGTQSNNRTQWTNNPRVPNVPRRKLCAQNANSTPWSMPEITAMSAMLDISTIVMAASATTIAKSFHRYFCAMRTYAARIFPSSTSS